MFITPENFIEIYKTSDLPLFYIRKGESTGGKIMKKFVKKFDKANDEERQERTEEGVELLDEFFEAYEYGEVNIELLASPQDGKESRLYHNVAWGEKPQKYGRVSSTGKPGSNQPSESWMMMQFMMQQQNQQNQLMMKMLTDSFQRDKEADSRTHKLQMDKFKLQRELEDADAASPKDMLIMEAIGAVKPLAMAFMASKNPMLGAALSQQAIAGMENTLPADIAEKSGAPASPGHTAIPRGTVQGGQHCLHNMSMDLVMQCVAHFMQKVFPDYNVNEVMPVVAEMVVKQKDMLRPIVIAAIEAKRKLASGTASPDDENDDE